MNSQSNDLTALLNRQEALINVLKKEYPFTEDPTQASNEIQ